SASFFEPEVLSSILRRQLKGISKNSDSVIPAHAGIQCFKSTGHRPSPVRRIIRDALKRLHSFATGEVV
ncbi:MAG: hypothetical protein PXX77_09560, partial [Gallionella sp.]|nr:hypothetical protein [Gallionella sp.]